jgi:hypothetical protein
MDDMNTIFAFRRTVGASGAALALAILASSVAAQATPQASARWQPFIGCWAPTVSQTTTSANASTPQTLCVVPVDGGSAVELATIADGRVIERERIEPTARRAVSREGCNGNETVSFSADNQRLYLRSDLMCTGDIRRRSTGLIAMASADEWLDIQTVTVGDANALRVVRYRSTEPANLPAEIAAQLSGQTSLAVSTARLAAASPVSTEDVLEVSSNIDAPAVEAWLLERKPEFSLDAKAIAELGNAGLPVTVVDLMVALAYPERFADALNDRGGALRPAQDVAAVVAPTTDSRSNDPFYWDRYRSSGYGRYYYSPYGYSRYGLYPNGYGIGYTPSRYNSGYYSRPVVIVVAPSEIQSTRPTMVKGVGYTRGRPRSSPPSTSVGSSGGSKSGTSSSSGGSSSSGTSSGSTGRVAKPRTPPPAK